MLASKRRLPFITTLHGTDITLVGTEPSYFPITKFSIKSDGVTSISEYLRQRTVDVFGITKPIHVIRNFVNCQLYKPAERPLEGEKVLLQCFELPPRETRSRLHPHPGAGAPRCPHTF